jgi:hypothetical protein
MNKKGSYTPVYDRLMKRVKVPKNKNKCWLWCGPVNNAGFGMIRGQTNLGDPKMVTVHRVMARHNGLDIKNKEVQHTCLTNHCVNPDHLVLGNAKERHTRIAAKHGRHWQKPKVPYKTCEHCNKTTHVIWFSRTHGDCYPNMNTKYSNYLRKKV